MSPLDAAALLRSRNKKRRANLVRQRDVWGYYPPAHEKQKLDAIEKGLAECDAIDALLDALESGRAEREAVEAIRSLLNRRKEDTECTRDPFWFIAQNAPGGRLMLAGVWFDRKSAEAHLAAYGYRYPKKAYVYCAAAEVESHLASIYRAEEAKAREAGS